MFESSELPQYLEDQLKNIIKSFQDHFQIYEFKQIDNLSDIKNFWHYLYHFEKIYGINRQKNSKIINEEESENKSKKKKQKEKKANKKEKEPKQEKKLKKEKKSKKDKKSKLKTQQIQYKV